MSATEKLRSMLDERGVEWSKPSGLNSRFADSITFIENVAVVSEIDGSDLLRINFDGTPEQAIAATLGEADEGCYLMRDGKKFPVELDYGFIGIMPITITVGGFRYLLEVPNGE